MDNMEKSKLQKKAGKYLVIFLIVMLVLTAVSRISASLTVPLVTTARVTKASLNYKIEGEGRIDTANTIYLDLVPGLEIEKVYAKKGQSVKKGDPLYCYNMKQLEEQIDKARNEYDVSKNAYDKQVLTESLKKEESDSSKEQKAVTRANEDYEKAKEQLKEAKQDYKDKIKEIKQQLSKTQKQEYETAQQEYDTIKDSYDDTKSKYEKQLEQAKEDYEQAIATKNELIKDANDALADAQSDLDDVLSKKTALLNCMATLEQHAKNQKYSELYTDLEAIFTAYFGKAEYAEIKDKISDANEELSEAEDNLNEVKAKWKLIMEEEERTLAKVDSSDPKYESALNQYNTKKLEQESAIKTAQNSVSNAKKQIKRVSPKYYEINEAATTYFYYIAGNQSTNGSTIYKNYYTAIIDSTVINESDYKSKSRAVEKAKAAITDITGKQEKLVQKAKDAITEITAEQKKELDRLKVQVDKKAAIIDELLDKVYEDKDGLRAARDAFNAKEEALDTAKRALEDAKYDYAESVQANLIKMQNDSINEQIAEIDKEQAKQDMKMKEEALAVLTDIYSAKGEVRAEQAGMITDLNIEPKLTTTGSEKVAITPSCAIFIGSFEKDYMEYVQIGDEITCTLTGYKNTVTGEVIDIAYNSEADNYTVTANLDEEEYRPGLSGRFVINKTSDKYDTCVPISAIRSDNSGEYVLVIRETNTILGTEYKAYRVNVTVEKKDYNTAVVNDILASDDEVITGSNRNIMEGDRVRKGSYE